MPTCSESPLPKKLGIKPGCRLFVVNAPEDFLARLAPMPDDVEVEFPAREPIVVAVLFAPEASILRKEFPKLKKRLAKDGGLWVAYPKKASGVATDLTEAGVQQFGLDAGLVDNKVCSIDDVWTAMRFVYRRVDK